jgi:mRNA interferase MazF
MNKHLATVVMCPITSQSKNYPSRVSFVLEDKINWIIIDQIRTIDKSRVIKYLTTLDNKSIDMVKDVIQETFVK